MLVIDVIKEFRLKKMATPPGRRAALVALTRP